MSCVIKQINSMDLKFKRVVNYLKLIYKISIINCIKFGTIFMIVVIFDGCKSSECETKENNNANRIIYQTIKDVEYLGGNWHCGMPDGHKNVGNIYGVTDEDIKILLKDLSKLENLSDINIEINLYKNVNRKDKNMRPGGKPVLKIKLNTQN